MPRTLQTQIARSLLVIISLANGFKHRCYVPPSAINLSGTRYGRLVAIERVPCPKTYNRADAAYWRCRCDCGREIVSPAANLRRGGTKSCGCARGDTIRSKVALPYGESAARTALLCMKANARRAGREWSISDEFARGLMERDCHYCGAPPSNVCIRRGMNGPCVYSGIDRIDSSRGYTTGNVVSCCHMCNGAKSDHQLHEFESWLLRAAAVITSRRST